MQCPHCRDDIAKEDVDEDLYFCPKCGKEIQLCHNISKRTNKICLALIDSNREFCKKCGQPVRSENSKATVDQDKAPEPQIPLQRSEPSPSHEEQMHEETDHKVSDAPALPPTKERVTKEIARTEANANFSEQKPCVVEISVNVSNPRVMTSSQKSPTSTVTTNSTEESSTERRTNSVSSSGSQSPMQRASSDTIKREKSYSEAVGAAGSEPANGDQRASKRHRDATEYSGSHLAGTSEAGRGLYFETPQESCKKMLFEIPLSVDETRLGDCKVVQFFVLANPQIIGLPKECISIAISGDFGPVIGQWRTVVYPTEIIKDYGKHILMAFTLHIPQRFLARRPEYKYIIIDNRNSSYGYEYIVQRGSTCATNRRLTIPKKHQNTNKVWRQYDGSVFPDVDEGLKELIRNWNRVNEVPCLNLFIADNEEAFAVFLPRLLDWIQKYDYCEEKLNRVLNNAKAILVNRKDGSCNGSSIEWMLGSYVRLILDDQMSEGMGIFKTVILAAVWNLAEKNLSCHWNLCPSRKDILSNCFPVDPVKVNSTFRKMNSTTNENIRYVLLLEFKCPHCARIQGSQSYGAFAVFLQ